MPLSSTTSRTSARLLGRGARLAADTVMSSPLVPADAATAAPTLACRPAARRSGGRTARADQPGSLGRARASAHRGRRSRTDMSGGGCARRAPARPAARDDARTAPAGGPTPASGLMGESRHDTGEPTSSPVLPPRRPDAAGADPSIEAEGRRGAPPARVVGHRALDVLPGGAPQRAPELRRRPPPVCGNVTALFVAVPGPRGARQLPGRTPRPAGA